VSEYNTDNPVHVKERKTKAQLTRQQELEDLRLLMTDQRFRRFMWQLLSRCRIYQLSYTGDAALTNFNEGMRQIGLATLADVHKIAMEDYLRMVSEVKSE
jgi:hypothetical protein